MTRNMAHNMNSVVQVEEQVREVAGEHVAYVVIV
jgi:hypothetical protein